MSLSDIMSAAGLTSWAEVGLVVSVTTFVGIVIYLFFRRSAAQWEDLRHMPLERDEP